jgi:hypothetical protein
MFPQHFNWLFDRTAQTASAGLTETCLKSPLGAVTG